MQPQKQQFVKQPHHIYNGQYIPRSHLTQEDNQLYFREFNKLHYTAYCIKTQYEQVLKHFKEMREKIQIAERSFQELKRTHSVSGQPVEGAKPRRFRRTNQMIVKPFKCTYNKCDKIYASEGSLMQHVKLKHEKQADGPYKKSQKYKRQHPEQIISSDDPSQQKSESEQIQRQRNQNNPQQKSKQKKGKENY